MRFETRRRGGLQAGPTIVVRDGRRTDLLALLEIYNDAVQKSSATFDLEPLTLAQRREWFSEHGRLHPLVVAVIRGEVVGYATLSQFRDKPGYAKSAEDSVYVRKDSQGRGVGTQLLRELVSRAQKLGYHTLIAGIVPPNDASIRLHEKFGFGYVGNFREVGLKFSRWQDVCFYQLFLPQVNKDPSPRQGAH